jgi:N-acetyl-anhydromuramyl-L-alanine amidase AmpD
MKKIVAFTLGAIVASTVTAFAGTPDLSSCDSWMPACTSNYTASSRPSSYPIYYVVIHKVEGTASSAANWFQNCSAGVSAHFVFNNSSGYCYQSVREASVAWHAGNWTYNTEAVGIEHGGYTASNDVATACYDESALETKSCIIYYSVSWDRSHVIGHYQVPGCTSGTGGGTGCHTDPGAYWNWTYYMSKCNPTPSSAQTYISDAPSSADWAVGTSATDKYGSNYLYHSTAAVSDPASWTINVAAGGSYDISAWWSQGSNRSASAPYILPGGASVHVNQQANGGKWNGLGNASLAAGNNTTQLSIWAATGYIVVADAVKYHGPN